MINFLIVLIIVAAISIGVTMLIKTLAGMSTVDDGDGEWLS